MIDPEKWETVIRMSYAFFAGKLCTDESLNRFIALMGTELKACGVSTEKAFVDLQRLHNVRMLGSAAILEDQGDHVQWFNPITGLGIDREIGWHFWEHFKGYLLAGKGWPQSVIDAIDSETNEILSRLEDPAREGLWDRRGMVMGGVQSGKTANYMGLIAKAIDSGYKLIIVFAGVHNSLRSQTQYRLNEEILGYDLDKVQEYSGQVASFGVRKMFNNHRVVQTLTSSAEGGDFSKRIAMQAGMVPTAEGPAIILVVKKHVSILKNVKDWATSIAGKQLEDGTVIVDDVPLLIIDDECDYASVNTKKEVLDENGRINEECDPAKTNMRIRELLSSFRRRVYIGYTATPFANIFIHHDRAHPRYGDDLFPRNFIISLPNPDNYIGPERVFGLNANVAAGIESLEPLPLLRDVSDYESIIPSKHKKDLPVASLPLSLTEAIKAFLITCAVRRLRYSSPPHCSMLVHVTRFTLVQGQVQELLSKEFHRLVDRIRSGSDELADFQSLWEEDFVPTTLQMEDDFGCEVHAWDDVVENLYPAVSGLSVRAINGSARESLDYRDADTYARIKKEQGEELPWERRGIQVIAIGGDKLSRGLTLDGLTVSYYLRASKMYDTLMQMGRWFGYRDGYADMCRIYTTSELMQWYRHIATASLELKGELHYMALTGTEPREFGLKVLSHPGQLAVTSAGKSRNAEKLDLSYSGRLSQTVVFDLSKVNDNLVALESLIRALGRHAERIGNGSSGEALHWTSASPEIIIQFLEDYETHSEAARVVDPGKFAQFIKEQLRYGVDDLTTWDVVIVSPRSSPKTLKIAGLEIGCSKRTPNSASAAENLAIKTLISPTDEWIDFSRDEKDLLRQRWAELRIANGKEPPAHGSLPPGPFIRDQRPKERGLLIVYALYCDSDDGRYGMEEGAEVIGLAVSFPGSNTTKQVTYMVGSVHQDAED